MHNKKAKICTTKYQSARKITLALIHNRTWRVLTRLRPLVAVWQEKAIRRHSVIFRVVSEYDCFNCFSFHKNRAFKSRAFPLSHGFIRHFCSIWPYIATRLYIYCFRFYWVGRCIETQRFSVEEKHICLSRIQFHIFRADGIRAVLIALSACRLYFGSQKDKDGLCDRPLSCSFWFCLSFRFGGAVRLED